MTGERMMDEIAWGSRLSGNPLDRAVPVYGGNDSYSRRGVAVRPWHSI